MHIATITKMQFRCSPVEEVFPWHSRPLSSLHRLISPVNVLPVAVSSTAAVSWRRSEVADRLARCCRKDPGSGVPCHRVGRHPRKDADHPKLRLKGTAADHADHCGEPAARFRGLRCRIFPVRNCGKATMAKVGAMTLGHGQTGSRSSQPKEAPHEQESATLHHRV